MSGKRPHLRPMSVGDLLDSAFRLYRRHLLLFIGIVAVIQVPLTFLQTVYQVYSWRKAFSTPYFLTRQTTLLDNDVVLALIFVVSQVLIGAAMTRTVSDRYLGRSPGLLDTYRALGWRWLKLVIALALVIALDVVIVVVFSVIPCLGWIVGLILLVYLNVPLVVFVAPVVVVENRGIFAALKRAFDLGRRMFWRVLGVGFLLFLLMSVIWIVLLALLTSVFTLWQPTHFETVAIIFQLVWLVVTLIVSPIWLCTFTLLYFDLRIRFEGFDLELMAQRMADEALSASRPDFYEGQGQSV